MRLTLADIRKIQDGNEKLVMLTCYDASFAALCDAAGVELLLIGDSLGMVIQGHDSTLPVTLDQTAYHVSCVARGSKRGLIIADLPFGTYQSSPAQAVTSSAAMIAAGANMVKIEGGVVMLDTIRFLVDRGIPVCGHVGLTPQSVNHFGGYRVQGRGDSGERVLADARAVEEAGAAMVVLEAMPAALGTRISEILSIPTIGIGAGPDCDGQVLVLHDMLDIYPGRKARFVRNFMKDADSVGDAIKRYVAAVKDGSFPAEEHCF
jgi:3-methyl-2-oxobutanoate hydroxymethyltransferase